MAITFSKTSGSGNSGKINITSDIYKGRLDKINNYSVSGSGASATIKITQVGFGLVNELSVDSYQISNEGGTFTIRGTSNGYWLNIAIAKDNELGISLKSLVVNGVTQTVSSNNQCQITDDPGANGTYEYIYTLECAKNNTIASRSLVIGIFAANEDGSTTEYKGFEVIQAEGFSYVYVSQTEGEETTSCNLTIESGETSTYVYIMSNDSWTISEV